MRLRDNQIDPVQRGITHLQGKDAPALIVAPTGMGKSIMIAFITKALQGKTLVIQPSKELLQQNYQKFTLLGGQADIYSDSMKSKELFGRVIYATIGSIKKIGDRFRKLGFKYIIIDEADRFSRSDEGMLGKFLSDSSIERILGLTATPFKLETVSRFNGSYSMLKMLTSASQKGDLFKDIIHVTQIEDIIKDKFWTNLRYEQHEFKGNLEMNDRKSEFTDESMMKASKDLAPVIIQRLQDLPAYESVLVFVSSVEEAQSLARKIPNSAAVWGDMPPEERDYVISNFRTKKIRVVINVNVLSIGFDYSDIDLIILARPTMSLSLYYQQIGRAVRLHTRKDHCLIIDLVGNVNRFGRVEHIFFKKKRVWTAWGKKGKDVIQLTGIPVHEIGQHIEGKKFIPKVRPKSSMKFDIGKYKDKYIHEAPDWYLKWMLSEYTFKNGQEKLKGEIQKMLL